MDDLRQLVIDLAKGIKAEQVVPVVQASGEAIKKQMRAEAGASRHFRMASTITSELKASASGFEVEVGPEKRGAGSLAVIAYFGGRHGGGATVPDPRGAMDAEAPNLEDALGKLGEDYL